MKCCKPVRYHFCDALNARPIKQVIITCKAPAANYTEELREQQKALQIPHLYKIDAEGLELQVSLDTVMNVRFSGTDDTGNSCKYHLSVMGCEP